MSLRDLFVAVGFNGGMAIGGLQEVNKAADDTKANLIEVGKQFDSLGKGMEKVGKGLMTKVTMPIIGLGTAAVGTVAKFDDQMSKAKAIAGATGDEFEQLRNQALQLGRDTRWSASQVAEAQTNLATAGFNVRETLTAMPGLLDLASAGAIDLGLATEITSGTLRGFGLEVEKTGHVADVLAKAATSTGAQIPDLGEGMKYVAPIARSLGVSLEDTTAAMGILADANIKGSQAGTVLRSAFSSLANPAGEARKMMEALGFEAFDTTGKMLPLPEVIGGLRKSLTGLTDEEKAMALSTIFGQQSLAGMMTLVEEGPEKLGKLSTAFVDADGAAAKMAGEMEDNLAGSFRSLGSALESLGIAFGDELKEPVRIVAGYIRDLAVRITEMDPAAKKAIVRMGIMAAAIGPVIWAGGRLTSGIGSLITGFDTVSKFAGSAVFAFKAVTGGAATLGQGLGFLLGPTGLAVAAIGALIAGGILLYRNWDTIKEKGGELITNLGAKVQQWAPFAQNVLDNLWSGIQLGLGVVAAGFSIVWPFIKNIVLVGVDTIVGVVGGLLRTFSGITDFIVGVFTLDWEKAWTGVVDIFGGIFDGLGSIAKGAINSVIGFVNAGIENVNKFKVPDWVPGIGGKGVNIPKIPKLAVGTNFFPGGQAIVGERGPELVTMPRGARVDTNTALRNITPEKTQNHRNYTINAPFSTTINVTVDGSTNAKEQIPDVKREVEKAIYPIFEEYWAQLRIKRPSMG